MHTHLQDQMTKSYILVFLGLIAGSTSAQQPPAAAAAQSPAASQPPKTRLEQFQAKTGSVVIKGFSEVGTAAGKYGSAVTVSAMEFTDASSGAKQYGITIEVKGSGEYPHKNTSYVDSDEVESLLNGIDYIGRADKTVTKLASFEATYRTKGDFGMTVFNSRQGTMVGVESGRFGSANAYFDIAELPKIRQLIQRAQATLQGAK